MGRSENLGVDRGGASSAKELPSSNPQCVQCVQVVYSAAPRSSNPGCTLSPVARSPGWLLARAWFCSFGGVCEIREPKDQGFSAEQAKIVQQPYGLEIARLERRGSTTVGLMQRLAND